MSAIDDRKARLSAAAFRQWGVPALWNGAAVTVIERAADQDVQIAGFGPAQVRGDMLMVQASDVASPERGDVVTISPGLPGQKVVTVFSQPKLDRIGVWACEVTS